MMEYRATPLEVTGHSPSQLLMGRMIRTTLPVPDEILKPKWPNADEVRRRDEKAKKKYEENYNRTHGARKLPVIRPGTMVRERLPLAREWSNARPVENQISDRKYQIRARRHLQPCPAVMRNIQDNISREQLPSQETSTNQEEGSSTSQPHQTTTRYGRLIKPIDRYGY